jgi:hypothetical protein
MFINSKLNSSRDCSSGVGLPGRRSIGSYSYAAWHVQDKHEQSRPKEESARRTTDECSRIKQAKREARR